MQNGRRMERGKDIGYGLWVIRRIWVEVHLLRKRRGNGRRPSKPCKEKKQYSETMYVLGLFIY